MFFGKHLCRVIRRLHFDNDRRLGFGVVAVVNGEVDRGRYLYGIVRIEYLL